MATAGSIKDEKGSMMSPWFAIDGQSYLGCFVGCYYHSDPNYNFAWLAVDLLSAQKVVTFSEADKINSQLEGFWSLSL